MDVSTIRLLDRRAAGAASVDVVRIYRSVWSVSPFSEKREQIDNFAAVQFPRHLKRDGFVLALSDARGRGGPVGFCYGYIGRHGQYWTDFAARELGPDAASRWLGGHFELAVLPEARGAGIGRALIHAVLDASRSHRTVLQTLAGDTPAARLYRSLGFEEIGAVGTSVFLGLDRQRTAE